LTIGISGNELRISLFITVLPIAIPILI